MQEIEKILWQAAFLQRWKVGNECKKKKRKKICNAVILILYYLLSSFWVQREYPRDAELLSRRHFAHSLVLFKEKTKYIENSLKCQWVDGVYTVYPNSLPFSPAMLILSS